MANTPAPNGNLYNVTPSTIEVGCPTGSFMTGCNGGYVYMYMFLCLSLMFSENKLPIRNNYRDVNRWEIINDTCTVRNTGYIDAYAVCIFVPY